LHVGRHHHRNACLTLANAMADTLESEAPDEDLQEQLYLLLSGGQAEEAVEGESALLATLAEPSVPDAAAVEVATEEHAPNEEASGQPDENVDVESGSVPEVLELNLAADAAGDDADTEPPDEVPDAEALDAEMDAEEEEEEDAVQDEVVEEIHAEEGVLAAEEEDFEEDLPEDAMALPVDVEPLRSPSTEEAETLPALRLPPRLQTLRRLLEAPGGPCEELHLSYRDFLRRLCERAAASGEPLAARDKVRFVWLRRRLLPSRWHRQPRRCFWSLTVTALTS